jgi:hypothetical protein
MFNFTGNKYALGVQLKNEAAELQAFPNPFISQSHGLHCDEGKKGIFLFLFLFFT